MAELLIGFAAGLLSSIPMLGPVALLLMAAGASRREREGRALALGAALSEGVHVALVVAGLAPWLLSEPAIAVWLRLVSGVVLLGLAVVAWSAKLTERRFEAETPLRAFGLGVVLVLPHPGFLVAWLALATFLAERGLSMSGPWFVAGAVLGIGAWFAVLLWGARRIGTRVVMARGRWIGRVLAIVLAGFGAWVLVSGILASRAALT